MLHLGTIERLTVTRTLHHHEGRLLDALECGVATAARQALSTPTDDRTIVGWAGVDNLVVVPSAERTAHAGDGSRSGAQTAHLVGCLWSRTTAADHFKVR